MATSRQHCEFDVAFQFQILGSERSLNAGTEQIENGVRQLPLHWNELIHATVSFVGLEVNFRTSMRQNTS